LLIVRALAGDSTMTSDLPVLAADFAAMTTNCNVWVI
jgi:hypothetical protein